MSISGISPASSGVDMTNTRMMPSIKVLDMAQNVFEDIASMLIEAMNETIAGLGENIDIYV